MISRDKLLKQTSIYFFLLSNIAFTFAQSCGLDNDDAPAPSAIACVLQKVIEIALIAAGGIFVAVIAYGAVKLAMATGDPGGYEGAKKTWQYGVIGILVILGAFSIFGVVGHLFGLDLGGLNMLADLEANITEFFNFAVTGQ